MDRKAWDHSHGAFRIDKHCFQCPVFFDDQPSGNPQWAVKPRRKERGAVFFHIQFDIAAILRDLRIFLDLKRRGIAVGGNDLIVIDIAFRKGKGDQRGIVPRNVI